MPRRPKPAASGTPRRRRTATNQDEPPPASPHRRAAPQSSPKSTRKKAATASGAKSTTTSRAQAAVASRAQAAAPIRGKQASSAPKAPQRTQRGSRRGDDLIGCHVSTAGGLHLAPPRADELGATAIQIFTANQRQWQAPQLTDDAVAAFRAALASSRVRAVMSHDSYLVNLASPKEDVRDKSLATFIEELSRCTRLGIPLMNFHPGAHLGEGEARAIHLVAEAMLRALDAVPQSKTRLVVELTAGQGTNIGHRLEHVAAILARVGAPERTAVCIDTAHVYAAGYDLRSEEGYAGFFADFDSAIGLERLAAFHLNDSKSALGSRVDRHEELGKGTLGLAFFERLARDPRFATVPMVLETPNEGRYAEEIELLRTLRS